MILYMCFVEKLIVFKSQTFLLIRSGKGPSHLVAEVFRIDLSIVPTDIRTRKRNESTGDECT